MQRFHHVGVATDDLEAMRDRYASLGYEAESDVIDDPGIGVTLQFLTAQAAPRIELVTPLVGVEQSPVDAWIRRRAHAYHVAYEVPDLDAAIAAQESLGALLVAPPQPAVAFGGRPVAFVTLTPAMLIEFIQLPDDLS